MVEPVYSIEGDTHRLSFDDGVCLEGVRPRLHHTEQLMVRVRALLPNGNLAHGARIDLLNQRELEQFHQFATAMDGQCNIDWRGRLLCLQQQLLQTLDTQEQQEAGSPSMPETPVPWPQLDSVALSGLAGQIVHTIAPHTESDPVALLVQLLTMVGNAIGRAPYFPVEADRHGMNLFTCLVGQTSKGRKGTSAGYPRRLLSEIDGVWGNRVTGGLSSGEGVIWHVRDATYGRNKAGEEVCLDEGVEDKRLCILETEFARALAKTGQEGNVLSAVLRQAWDHGNLNTLVSGRHKAPVSATHAHVSVIAHITVAEVQKLLTEMEAANGFGNRFLWVCVQRSRLLPDGGLYPEEALKPLVKKLALVLQQARTVARMQRSPGAQARWRESYTTLAEGAPGLLGAITARAEAQVLRLSCLYALLDKTATIGVSHLQAAYALWRYCEASARYIFGDLLGDPLADDLLRILRQALPEGLTRTDIQNAFARNVKGATIGQALVRLQRAGLARCTGEQTAGRPAERWFACVSAAYHPDETNEKNEKSPQDDPLHAFSSFNSLVCRHTQRDSRDGKRVCTACGEVLQAETSPLAASGACPACRRVGLRRVWGGLLGCPVCQWTGDAS